MNTRILLVPLAAVCTLAAAGPAAATTFCVPGYTAACPDNGTNVAITDLEVAMETDAADGVADRIVLAPGTISDPGGWETTDAPDPLEIAGAGVGVTTLTTGPTSISPEVLDLTYGDRPVTLRDVRVVVPASAPPHTYAVRLGGDLMERVDIESHAEAAHGVFTVGGGTVRDSRLYGRDGGYIGIGVREHEDGAGTVVVERSQISSAEAGVFASGDAAAIVRRTRIDAGQGLAVGVESGGYVSVENSVMTTHGPRAVLARCEDYAGATVNVNHSTIVSEAGLPYGSAIDAEVEFPGGSCNALLSNSIASGFAKGYSRSAPIDPDAGNANLTVRYSNLPAAGWSTGDGNLSVGTGNIDADPKFIAPGDFHLQPGSPSVDGAAPGGPAIPFDFDGNARELDGDGDGTARRDMGAYELAPSAPPNPGGDPPSGGDPPAPVGDAPVTAPPAADRTAPRISRLRVLRRSRTLRLTLSEAATLKVRVGKRGLTFKAKAGANRLSLKRRLRKGRRYTVTVVATDAAGNSSTTARLRTRI